MNPSTERLQSVLDQELESAIANQRELDYRALFLAELERSTLNDDAWVALLHQLLSLLSGGAASRKCSAPSSNFLTASCSAASLPLGQP